MGVIDQWVNDIIKNLFGVTGNGWVKRNSKSSMDLETCGGVAIGDSVTNTCELCVALNKTIFKNNNKPLYYHKHCKCRNRSYNLVNVTLDFPEAKVNSYLFKNEDKYSMMKSMGYFYNDWNKIYQIISNIVKKEFFNGNYVLGKLNNKGQHFQINYILVGANEHINQNFQCHTGCIAYPNGKIKVATPLVKDKEIIL